MKRAIPLLAGALLFGELTTPQGRLATQEEDEPRRAYPGGKNLSDELLKAEHEKAIKESEQLIKLSQELKDELEKNTRFVMSIATIKKTEEIEKLAKRIRGRIQR